jgi:polysaccharide pyruvyl transferase WcaK-like protein
MLIGILTFHDGINHGAYFQVFALQNYLLEHGFQVEIINYKNKAHYINEYKAFLFIKNPIILLNNIIKIIKFRRDQKKLNISGFITTGFIANRLKKSITKYDIIIVGSDIVWNYEWDFTGKDPIYFGDGLENKRLVAYAASCGDANLNDIPVFVRLGLRKFSSISVRDKHTANLVSLVLGVEPPVVMDPTLLYDFSKFDGKKTSEGTPYILIYAYYVPEKIVESIIEFARSRKLKLIAIGYYNKWCNTNHINIGPFEWLGYIKNAAFIITSTFHGTIFSIINKKPFVTIPNKPMFNKTSTILSMLKLDDRLTESNNAVSILEKNIDYNRVDTLLSPAIEKSKDFLLQALQ